MAAGTATKPKKQKAANGKATKATKAKKEKAAKAIKEPKAKTLSEIQQEHYEQIKQKEIEVREKEGVYLSLKEQTKDAKGLFEDADHALRRLIASGPDAQKKLPFQDNAPAPDAEKKPARVKIVKQIKSEIPGDDWTLEVGEEFDCEVNPQGAVAARVERLKDPIIGLKPDEFEVIAWHEPMAPANTDAWRKTPLIEVLAGKALLETLAQTGIETMGQLCDYTASGKHLTDLPGIGPGQEAKIGDATADWFAKHPEACDEPKEKTVQLFVAGEDRGEMSVGEATDFIVSDARKNLGVNGNGKHK